MLRDYSFMQVEAEVHRWHPKKSWAWDERQVIRAAYAGHMPLTRYIRPPRGLRSANFGTEARWISNNSALFSAALQTVLLALPEGDAPMILKLAATGFGGLSTLQDAINGNYAALPLDLIGHELDSQAVREARIAIRDANVAQEAEVSIQTIRRTAGHATSPAQRAQLEYLTAVRRAALTGALVAKQKKESDEIQSLFATYLGLTDQFSSGRR